MKNRNRASSFILWLPLVFFMACTPSNNDIPTIGFVDAFEDNTIKQAKDGFLNALKDKGAGGFSLILPNVGDGGRERSIALCKPRMRQCIQ